MTTRPDPSATGLADAEPMLIGTTVHGKGKLHIWKLHEGQSHWARSLCGLNSVPILFGSVDSPDICARCSKGLRVMSSPQPDQSATAPEGLG